MARVIQVALGSTESSFTFKPVDRAALYGKRRRVALDGVGEPCTRASLLDDGSMILKSGMTGQGYFLDDGSFIKQSELEGFGQSGEPIEKVPSTLGNTQELVGPIDESEVLDLRVSTIYALEAESLAPDLAESLGRGDIYKFAFNYRDDYRAETGVLLSNDEGYFALIGLPTVYMWSRLSLITELPASDEDTDDELDFEMF
jgi:hypothetical protein